MAAQPAQARKRSPVGSGVFGTVDEAVAAAAKAQPHVAAMSLEDRGRMIGVIRGLCDERADELGRMEMDETRIGRLDHKIAKLKAMKYVARRRGDAERGAQRRDRPLPRRARPLGRDRHGAAGDPLGADAW